MCGIVGVLYADADRPCSIEAVTSMRDVLSYRGPDDAGAYVDGHLGLGHRRLSIIDLGMGHQPMASHDQALWIVFNGEIYNYRELRSSLTARGSRFLTNSDTEVILNLYAESGERCVEALNGMFAFAIWDRRRQSLFLARDRMGVKPLYYAETPEGFVFASEIKGILASGMVTARPRDEALAEYLLFRHVAGDETLFRGVKSLPPGCTMVRAGAHTRLSRFWSPLPSVEPQRPVYREARRQLGELLESAVRMRMISDVPLGTFCSGGVDSSLVTAIAARIKGEPVNTFSIGFDESEYDESEYAEMVSRRYGTIHHRLRLGNVEFSDLLPKMVWHNDEPLNFANSVQIFALSRLAKERVTVVLTGEGSDELFAGYPRYRIPGLAKYGRLVPASLRRAVSAWSGDHRVKKLFRFADMPVEDMLLFNTAFLRPDWIHEISPHLPSPSLLFRRESLSRSTGLGLDAASCLSLLDQDTYLVSILHRQDKMSMAAGIESRVPFMDYRIVEFANSLPAKFKLTSRSGKRIVKDVARSLLPDEIVDRRKSGFGVPLERWFRAPDGLGERALSLPEIAPPELFDRGLVGRLVREHRSGHFDHSETLWTILNVCLWRQAFSC